MSQAELNNIGDREWPGLRYVPQGVPARIAIFAGIGQRAYAHAIQHDPHNSRKRHSSLCTVSIITSMTEHGSQLGSGTISLCPVKSNCCHS
jgi:hypothetical protein